MQKYLHDNESFRSPFEYEYKGGPGIVHVRDETCCTRVIGLRSALSTIEYVEAGTYLQYLLYSLPRGD